MKRYHHLASLMLAIGIIQSAPAALETNNLRAVIDVGTTFMGKTYSDDDVISIGEHDAGSLFNTALQGIIRPGMGIDALIVHTNLIIFSADIGFSTGGTDYEDEDLVSFNAITETFSMYFDGTANGIHQRADLDAATFIPGTTTLLYSVDITLTGLVSGITVTDEDVIQFVAGVNTLRFNGITDLGIEARADLDALHSDGTNLYYSLDITTTNSTIAGTGKDRDVWCLNTNTLAGTLIADIGFTAGVDVTSLDEPIFSDDDALSDFEEITGVDDPATAISSDFGIDPEGNITDAFDTDSDDDGSDDGQEAVAGTNPNDPDSQLVITAVRRENGTNYITWASVTNRSYDLVNTGNPYDYTNTVSGGINPGSTNVTFAHVTSVDSNLLYSVNIDVTP